jgi:hypothetical protein
VKIRLAMRHGRRVALKVLRPDLASLGAERFRSAVVATRSTTPLGGVALSGLLVEVWGKSERN